MRSLTLLFARISTLELRKAAVKKEVISVLEHLAGAREGKAFYVPTTITLRLRNIHRAFHLTGAHSTLTMWKDEIKKTTKMSVFLMRHGLV